VALTGLAVRPSSVAVVIPGVLLACCNDVIEEVLLTSPGLQPDGPLPESIGFIPFGWITAAGLGDTTGSDPSYFHQVQNVPFGGSLPVMITSCGPAWTARAAGRQSRVLPGAYSAGQPEGYATWSFPVTKAGTTIYSTGGTGPGPAAPFDERVATVLGEFTVAACAAYVYVAATANTGCGRPHQAGYLCHWPASRPNRMSSVHSPLSQVYAGRYPSRRKPARSRRRAERSFLASHSAEIRCRPLPNR
jgi:hypothetical protein